MILTVVTQVFGFVGSLCLLLFGMNMLSDGIQKAAGNNLQKLLGKITGNRFTAMLTGIGVTSIIQSSGATTVMVVSFVNAEILSLQQAIGVIFGANIGTTITAWIVSLFGFSFSISAAAIPLFGVGYILKFFKKWKIHNCKDCFMGFAFLFMGLDLLKKTLSLSPSTVAFLNDFANLGFLGLLLGVLIGAFITALIHSSSAMTAIVLTMAANGSLSWELSAAIVLGSNIGSTIDAVMSSFGASVNAKRTAFVHVSFNVVGTLVALCFFVPFLELVDLIVPLSPVDNITTHIAMLHTVFNCCATLLFLPFVNQIALFATKVIHENEKNDDEHYKLPAILPNTHVSADLYSFLIQKEIVKMAAKDMEMFDFIGSSLRKKVNGDLDKIDTIENYVDEMNESITHFLQKCSRLPNANKDDRIHFAKMIQITEHLEYLSDECASLSFSLKKYIKNDEFDVKSKETKQINEYLEMVRSFFEDVCINLTLGFSNEQKFKYETIENQIDKTKKELKRKSRHRIEDGNNVKAELVYIDLIRKIERAGDCIFAIVQVM